MISSLRMGGKRKGMRNFEQEYDQRGRSGRKWNGPLSRARTATGDPVAEGWRIPHSAPLPLAVATNVEKSSSSAVPSGRGGCQVEMHSSRQLGQLMRMKGRSADVHAGCAGAKVEWSLLAVRG